MLPDPAALRAAATTLSRADDDAMRRAVLTSAREAHWQAPAADRVKVGLSQSDALARTGSDDLGAGARHLRALATAVETLEELMRLEHARAAAAMRADIAALPPDRPAWVVREAHQQLAFLPGPTDPYWAGQVEVPPVPAPALRSASPAQLVELGPFVGVSIDVAAVRGVAAAAGRLAHDLERARDEAAGAVTGLPYDELDRYRLPGTAAEALLREITGCASSLALAAAGYDDDARRAAALADLVERADAAGVSRQELLGDPRSTQAVDLAALLAEGASPEDVWAATGDAGADDLAWLMSVVPGLEAELSTETGDDGLPVTWLDGADWLNGLLMAPRQAADRAAARAGELGADAKAIKPVSGATAAQRAAYREAIRAMRSARGEAARFSGLASRVPLGGVLSRLNAPVAAGTPVLRNVPVLAVLFTGVGTALDVENGMSVEHAAAKNVTATAAGLGAAALTTSLVAGTAVAATAAAPVLLAVGVGAVVSYGTGKLVEHYGDDIADAAGDLAGGAADLADDAWDSTLGKVFG